MTIYRSQMPIITPHGGKLTCAWRDRDENECGGPAITTAADGTGRCAKHPPPPDPEEVD